MKELSEEKKEIIREAKQSTSLTRRLERIIEFMAFTSLTIEFTDFR